MKARFDGILNTDILKKPKGKKWFKSTTVVIYISEATKTYYIPIGTYTDFGSVPRGLRWLIPRIGAYNYACYFHDWLCEEKIENRKENDRLFLEAMKVCGLGKIKRGIRWFGTRSYSILTRKK